MSGTVMVGLATAQFATAQNATTQLDRLARGWTTRAVQRALLWVQPDGGQGRARRNAWSSMVVDSRRRAERVEAERSVALANAGTSDVGPARQTVTA